MKYTENLHEFYRSEYKEFKRNSKEKLKKRNHKLSSLIHLKERLSMQNHCSKVLVPIEIAIFLKKILIKLTHASHER